MNGCLPTVLTLRQNDDQSRVYATLYTVTAGINFTELQRKPRQSHDALWISTWWQWKQKTAFYQEKTSSRTRLREGSLLLLPFGGERRKTGQRHAVLVITTIETLIQFAHCSFIIKSLQKYPNANMFTNWQYAPDSKHIIYNGKILRANWSPICLDQMSWQVVVVYDGVEMRGTLWVL